MRERLVARQRWTDGKSRQDRRSARDRRVRDIAHPESAEQAADVADILASLGVKDSTPMFEIWNKLDLLPPEERAPRVADLTAALGWTGRATI